MTMAVLESVHTALMRSLSRNVGCPAMQVTISAARGFYIKLGFSLYERSAKRAAKFFLPARRWGLQPTSVGWGGGRISTPPRLTSELIGGARSTRPRSQALNRGALCSLKQGSLMGANAILKFS